MNLFRNNGRESVKNVQSSEPHGARRAVRYAAADNAQAALQRQFPGTSFGQATQSVQTAGQPIAAQVMSTNVGVQQDDFTQAA